MRPDQYAPIELGDRAPTSTGAPDRRSPRRILVSMLGLLVAAALSVLVSDGSGVNLETASDDEAVADIESTADDASPPNERGTLVVRSADDAPADVLGLDRDGIDGDDTTGADGSAGSETSLGSAESADSESEEIGPDPSAAAAEPNRSAPTTASAGSRRDSGGTPESTSTTTARSTTRPPTTSQQTSTSQRITTTTTPINVSGQVVWIDSRAGSGGDGSQARPYRTVNEGILAVRAGETLMIKGGEYREHVNPGYRMPKGTSTSPITMTNAPGERVVIKGRVILTDMDYWTIRGINVTWDSDRNDRSVQHLIIMNGGVDWEWRDSEIWGAKAYSAMLITENPRNFAVRYNHIHDTYRTNDTNQDHLIYCSCGTGGGIIERNLLVGSINGRAVKLGGSSSSKGPVGNVTIRYNTMVDNYGPSNIQLSFNTSNITMERNLMVGSQDYAENISTWELTGSGSRAVNNLGFKSPGVVENHRAIADGGGNIYRDPRLDSNNVPQDSTARAYGHKAP